MATSSSILAWRFPWTEEPGGLQSMGLQRGRHDSLISCIALQITASLSLTPNETSLFHESTQVSTLAHTGTHTHWLTTWLGCICILQFRIQPTLQPAMIGPFNILPYLVQGTSLHLEHSPECVHICTHTWTHRDTHTYICTHFYEFFLTPQLSVTPHPTQDLFLVFQNQFEY